MGGPEEMICSLIMQMLELKALVSGEQGKLFFFMSEIKHESPNIKWGVCMCVSFCKEDGIRLFFFKYDNHIY